MAQHNKIQLVSSEKIIDVIDAMYFHQNTLQLSQDIEACQFRNFCRIKLVNLHTQEFVVRPKDLEIPFSFNEKLYIHAQNISGSITFKTKAATFCRERFLSLKIPQKIIIKNQRESERHDFSKYNVVVYYTNPTIQDFDFETSSQKAKLFDISDTGISIVTNIDIRTTAYKENDKIIFSSINTLSLKERITGKITYISKFQKNDNEFYRIGIQFDQEIPFEKILENLTDVQLVKDNKRIL